LSIERISRPLGNLDITTKQHNLDVNSPLTSR
jgi:hypothetical protein